MRMSVAVVAVGLVAFPAGAADPDKATAADLKAIQGKWSIVSVVRNGEELDAAVQLGMEVTFKGSTLRLTGTAKGFTPQERAIRLDGTTDPRILDFTEKEADFKAGEQTFDGVYTLDGDTLRWCLGMDGDQLVKGRRPAKVESKAGSNALLVVLKRVKE